MHNYWALCWPEKVKERKELKEEWNGKRCVPGQDVSVQAAIEAFSDLGYLWLLVRGLAQRITSPRCDYHSQFALAREIIWFQYADKISYVISFSVLLFKQRQCLHGCRLCSAECHRRTNARGHRLCVRLTYKGLRRGGYPEQYRRVEYLHQYLYHSSKNTYYRVNTEKSEGWKRKGYFAMYWTTAVEKQGCRAAYFHAQR